MSYKILVNTSAWGYNAQAMREIKEENNRNARLSYNTNAGITDATRSKYIEQEGKRIEAIIKKYVARCVKSIEYSNGLVQYTYLDRAGKIVCEDTLSETDNPRFGIVAESI